MKGIIYTTTGERRRSQLNSYHCKPSVLDHSLGATKFDVKDVKNKVIQLHNNNYRSNYTIGFEIEKSSFGEGQRKEYALIQGYEMDGSCGVEAVTNILPLLPRSQWRNKIFDMIFKAKGIMNDADSPSTLNCGGHITIGVRRDDNTEMLGRNLREMVRLNASILFALFRYRLRNSYCRSNLRMQNYHDENGDRINHYNGFADKYQASLAKSTSLEFRIPTRITSYKQMFRRYELMYEIVDFSVTKPNGRFASLLGKVRPIILSMYENDVEKTDMVLSLAKDFRKFIKDGTISNSIREFI